MDFFSVFDLTVSLEILDFGFYRELCSVLGYFSLNYVSAVSSHKNVYNRFVFVIE